MKCLLLVTVFILVGAAQGDVCDQCVPREQCQAFTNMGRHEQVMWTQRFPCEGPTNNTFSVFGFASVAKGDQVCCTSSIWGVDNTAFKNKNNKTDSPAITPEYQNFYPQSNRRNPYLYGNQNPGLGQNMFGNQQLRPGYGGQNYPNQNLYGGQQNFPNGINQKPGNQGLYGGQGQYNPGQGFLGNGQNMAGNPSLFGNQNRPGNQGYLGNGQNQIGQPNLNVNQQNLPGNQGSQNPFGNQQTPINGQGYLGQNLPGNQNIYGQQNNPVQNINGIQRPGMFGSPNQNFGNQFNRPNDQSNFNNPQNSNRRNFPSTNGITNPWDQNTPQLNVPNQVQPGYLNSDTPSTINETPYYPRQSPNGYGNNGQDASGGSDRNQQCALMRTSLPPTPESGCCGVDMSDSVQIADLGNLLSMFAPAQNQNNYWNRPRYQQPARSWPSQGWPNYQRRKRAARNITAGGTLDDRIAGGRETELDQFPWTVLLKTTFDYGDKTAAFSCGGSLISRRYVLTAGHCVYEAKARISDVEVTLAEFDKRTFPIDCITVFGGGRECVRNIVVHAEDVVHHPEYDDDRLLNDIALVRLNTFTPYTRYIRPVCLPTINVDIPEFSNLPLSVVGWGRDGQYVSDVKQSTVVQLVPPDECIKSYPRLSKSHLCAAGRTGEDTCKGDSGGPLMMLLNGRYYIIGVVSGKRADTPCGSKVPSLYSNVYQFVDWIRSTIRE